MRTYFLALVVMVVISGGHALGQDIHKVTSSLPNGRVANELMQSALKLAGRTLSLCANSSFKPQSQDGTPLTFSQPGYDRVVLFKSATVGTVDPPWYSPLISPGGSEFIGSLLGCKKGHGTCYEIDAIGSMRSVEGKDVKLSILLQAKDMANLSPDALMNVFAETYSAMNGKFSLAPGTPEEDIYCLLGRPRETNDYGSGGLQLVYPDRPDGSQIIVYLNAAHTLENVQDLHQSQ